VRGYRNARDSTPQTREHKLRPRFIIAAVAVAILGIVALREAQIGSGGCPLGADVGGAAWSPNGSSLAFAARNSSGFHIYSLDVVTRRLSQLTHSQCGNEVAPAWSPAGRRLAYERSNGERGIYVVRADGGGSRRVISGEASGPAWAPDGKRLAYVVGGSLWIARLSGGRALRLKTGDYLVDRPAWSPDGGRIAFGANLRGDTLDVAFSVRGVSIHGGRAQLLVGDGSDPAWSPDGASLVYEIYSNFAGPTQIRIADRSGGDRLVHNLPEGNAIPSWSPDGKAIAILWYAAGDRGDHVVVYLVRPDGTGFRRIYVERKP
jgi:Tol biopolymer transport system component